MVELVGQAAVARPDLQEVRTADAAVEVQGEEASVGTVAVDGSPGGAQGPSVGPVARPLHLHLPLVGAVALRMLLAKTAIR